ncbi:guanine nucleotide binding protein, alpha subunit, partial [Meredithblackwellia eburnea MCA 4105]
MFQLNDSAKTFFDSIERIGMDGYLPTDQDILRTRVRSTGICEERFLVKKHQLRVFDIGGQRSERKKWIHCFENVHVLLFVAAISEIGQQLWEDETISRLDEATMLFESISSSRWFEKSAFVLFLNKVDLFREKLQHVSLASYYPEYNGGASFENACQFMLQKFTTLDKRRAARPLYTHFTQATDTSQVRVVLAAMMDSVLASLLEEVGLL